MPLYDYKCSKCAEVVEVRHGFDERYEEPCPRCGGALSRVFNPAPIVFKGSGFYVTDSRAKSSDSKPAESKSPEKPVESKSADSKPAEPKKSEPAAAPTKSESSASKESAA